MALSRVDVLEGGAGIRAVWEDGSEARFHAIWLRDNAQDAETRDPGNGQRLISLADIPSEIAVAGATGESGDLSVAFNDGHETVFASD